MQKNVIRDISLLIYKLFVVNTCAAGIQQKNGLYIRKFIPITPQLIEHMILSKGSMGCYQQGYKTGYVRWICFDFDCVDKDNPDIEGLDNSIIQPFTAILDKLHIRYMKEFSGRRGIHVWVIFDRIMKKEVAYNILHTILRKTNIESSLDRKRWNLDLFPATDSSRNNKFGKQVKFPLSSHKNGMMSFFYIGKFNSTFYDDEDSFFYGQYELLNRFVENKLVDVLGQLELSDKDIERNEIKYKKYHVLGEIETTTEEIRNILIQTRVFKNIFERMMRGQAMPQDWTVLLGTLSPIDEYGVLIHRIFEEFPNYDAVKTSENLKKYKDRYFPATFRYLYRLYELEMEKCLVSTDTGLIYLLKKLGVDNDVVHEYIETNEQRTLDSVADTIVKEHNYLIDNDEVSDVYIMNRLLLLKKYDRKQLHAEIDEAINTGVCRRDVTGFRIYKRIESEEKSRLMVSLSAYDRVITTQLALKLCCAYDYKWKSFSYKPALTARSDIFYSWYGSWGRYIDQIRTFLETPFFEDYEIIYLDLLGFYDHIDFLTVYHVIEEDLDESPRNIMKYLIGYNDILMSELTGGKRIGVPQGPAYARIIAEIFLTKVLDIVTEEYSDKIHLYRYVDDIVIICEQKVDSEEIFSKIKSGLMTYGLPINLLKSKCFGKIGELRRIDRDLLLHVDNFNYDLREDDYTGVLISRECKEQLKQYNTTNPFNIRAVGYIFGSKTFQNAKEWYFDNYRHAIMQSIEGRGSGFRKFYFYVLRHEDCIKNVLDEGSLNNIKIGSLNFSNLIGCIYYCVLNDELNEELFVRIQREYLDTLVGIEIDQHDRAVIDALLRIRKGDMTNE